MSTMRDAFIEELHGRMREDESIFFLSADFGSPRLDSIRKDFGGRFLNVGIAEQNLVNVSTGLALEGFTVYAYAIAPFLTMRAYEQIRINLALQSQLKELNVNLVGVGAGMSYDVSGPTHHCLEDLSIMRTLPNIVVFSPSDTNLTRRFVDYSIKVKAPKYLRFDGKALPEIYTDAQGVRIEDGFFEVRKGGEICLVSTGYMTHKAIRAAKLLYEEGVEAGVLDIFLLKPVDADSLYGALRDYRYIVTLEEGFTGKGGLDSVISCVLEERGFNGGIKRMGLGDEYMFDIGSREYLHKSAGLSEEDIIRNIKTILKVA